MRRFPLGVVLLLSFSSTLIGGSASADELGQLRREVRQFRDQHRGINVDDEWGYEQPLQRLAHKLSLVAPRNARAAFKMLKKLEGWVSHEQREYPWPHLQATFARAYTRLGQKGHIRQALRKGAFAGSEAISGDWEFGDSGYCSGMSGNNLVRFLRKNNPYARIPRETMDPSEVPDLKHWKVVKTPPIVGWQPAGNTFTQCYVPRRPARKLQVKRGATVSARAKAGYRWP